MARPRATVGKLTVLAHERNGQGSTPVLRTGHVGRMGMAGGGVWAVRCTQTQAGRPLWHGPVWERAPLWPSTETARVLAGSARKGGAHGRTRKHYQCLRHQAGVVLNGRGGGRWRLTHGGTENAVKVRVTVAGGRGGAGAGRSTVRRRLRRAGPMGPAGGRGWSPMPRQQGPARSQQPQGWPAGQGAATTNEKKKKCNSNSNEQNKKMQQCGAWCAQP